MAKKVQQVMSLSWICWWGGDVRIGGVWSRGGGGGFVL